MKHIKPSKNSRRMLVTTLAVLVLGANAKAIDTSSEYRRKQDNSIRLQKLHEYMRPKVAHILTDLEMHGYRPLIDFQVYRTPAQQAALKRKGVSKVSYSFHNVTGKNGRPESLAADITNIEWGWTGPKQVKAQDRYLYMTPFWLKLASAAQNHDLTTGIYWGLNTKQRQAIRTAIVNRKFDAKLKLGWDTAHVQPVGITIPEARRGVRPRAKPVQSVATTKLIKRIISTR